MRISDLFNNSGDQRSDLGLTKLKPVYQETFGGESLVLFAVLGS